MWKVLAAILVFSSLAVDAGSVDNGFEWVKYEDRACGFDGEGIHGTHLDVWEGGGGKIMQGTM